MNKFSTYRSANANPLHTTWRGAFGKFVVTVMIMTLPQAAEGWDFGGRSAEGWSKFRGPLGNGVANQGGTPPISWDQQSGVTWQQEINGQGWSSPVVVGDEVIFTLARPVSEAESSSEIELVLRRLKRETGELISDTVVFTQSEDQTPTIHSKNSHASPTPWVTEDRIFCHFGYQGTAALTRDGTIVWTNRELRFPPVHGNGGSPVLVGDRLIFTCDGAEEAFVAALDAKNGELVWRTNRPVNAERKFSFSTPTAIEVDGKTQVICPGSDCVIALSPDDGKIIWQVRYDGYSVVPKPIYADGLVFVATGFGPTQVLAIDPQGTGDVTDSHVVWSLDRSAPKTPSLLAYEGLLYVLSDDGILTVLQTETGELVYRERIGGKYSSSPVLANGHIYLTSEEGVIHVVRAGQEFDEAAVNKMDERTLASPAIIDGQVFLRTERAIYCIE